MWVNWNTTYSSSDLLSFDYLRIGQTSLLIWDIYNFNLFPGKIVGVRGNAPNHE